MADRKPTPIWTDVSSYERGKRGTVEPNTWELQLPAGVRVTVHRWHGLTGWHMTCHELRVDREQLEATSAPEARFEALRLLAARADEILQALRTAP